MNKPNPPIYRSQATCAGPGHGVAMRQRPFAPPVYRPQPVPKVLQTKRSSGQNPQARQAQCQSIAPPVYRPEAKKMVQPKAISPLRKLPSPPSVYRPETKKISQPRRQTTTPSVNLRGPHSLIQRMLRQRVEQTSIRPDVVVRRDPYDLIDAKLGVTVDGNTIGIANFGSNGRTPITVHVHYHSIPLGFRGIEIHVTGANVRATDEVNDDRVRYQGATVYSGDWMYDKAVAAVGEHWPKNAVIKYGRQMGCDTCQRI